MLLSATTVGAAQPAGVVTVDQSFERLRLNEQLLYLPDLEQSYSLNQVLQSDADLDWRQVDTLTDSLIQQGGLYWFRVTLVNPGDEDLNLLLQTEYPLINVADLYRIDGQGNIETIYADAGLEGSFDTRPLRHPTLLNNLQVAAGESATFIWRIDSEPLLMFRATLWDPVAFAEWDFSVQLLQGMMYGTLLVMLLYNLFIYFSTWHKGYIFYVAYLGTGLYLLASQQGHLYQYIAPEMIWAKLPIHGLFYSLNTLMFGEFTIRFLDLRKRFRGLMVAVRVLTGLAIALIISVLITSNIYLVATGFTVIGLLYLTALLAGVLVRKRGVVSAGHFVIAIMILTLSVIISNMATVGLIESNGLTNNMTGVGITLMLVFFSLALADRINQLQKEVAQANRTVKKANEEKLKAEAELNNSKKQRIKLEQSFNRARLESRSKSDFIATLGHEIQHRCTVFSV